ncbi:MAG: hypothetical protein EBX40_02030 [Gammaproteobacteria bacterium]|nr:hypothetical protein [Gammaproteobacteria bacterium]
MSEHRVTAVLSEVCDTVRLRGVYSDYETCAAKLKSILKSAEEDDINFIMMNMNYHVFFKNVFSEYQWCSPLFAQLMGISCPEEIAGKNDFDFNWTRSMAMHAQEADEKVLLNTGKYAQKEYWALPDGNDRVFNVRRYPVFDKAGQVIGLLGLGREELIPQHLKKTTKYTVTTLLMV